MCHCKFAVSLVVIFLAVCPLRIFAQPETIFRLHDETQLIHTPAITDEYFSPPLAADQLAVRISANPNDAEAYIQWLYRLKKDGQHAEAVRKAKEVPTKCLSNTILLNVIGAVLLHSHQYDDLNAICQRAIADNPKYADAYNLMGIVAQERGYAGTAIYHFEKALSLNKKLKLINFNLANAYRAAGKYDDAVNLYTKSLKKFMSDKNFVSSKNFRFRQLSEAWVWDNIGIAHTMAGNYDAALASYRHALTLTDHSARILNGMACTYYEMGMRDTCIAYLNRSIEQSRRFSSPHKNLGNIYYDKGEFTKALEYYNRALELDPDDEWLICRAACAHKNLKEYDTAISMLKTAVEIDPSDAEAYYQQGLCHYRLSQTEEAQAAFRKALSLGCDKAKGWIR